VGAPLETDHARHPEHFELLDQKRDITRRAKTAANKMWRHWAAYIEKYSDRGIDWERDAKKLVAEAELNQPQLERLAEEEFLRELRRLIDLQAAGRIQPPDDSFSLD
jgi:hypothetical protein